MNFYVLTLFTDIIKSYMSSSIMGRASTQGRINLTTVDIRDFSSDSRHRRVDDYPYGGGAGMVMEAEPVYKAYEHVVRQLKGKARVIFLTPQGKVFNQTMAEELAKEEELIFLCGHYEGIDERILQMIVTDEVSIGDYILTGGELAALSMMDSITRLVPGVLHNEESAVLESLQGSLLEYPQYTRPDVFMGRNVPQVLLSGNHADIDRWRREQSLLRTRAKRMDLFEKADLSIEDRLFLYTHDGRYVPESKNTARKRKWMRKNHVMEEKKMLAKMKERFIELFGDEGEIRSYFAPGRINLIGEHTDYNGGHVFPCALTIGTYAVARKNGTDKIRLFSMNFDQKNVLTADMDTREYDKELGWGNYPLSVVWCLKESGYKINQGLDIVFYGNIPYASGLSSSASIEVLTGTILIDMFALNIDMATLAKYCQKAENEFVGVKCGILDQFAIAMGKKNAAVFLDCSRMDYEYMPLNLNGYKLVIMNTKLKRGLADSKYNERRSECEAALKELQAAGQIGSLGELNIEQFSDRQNLISNPVWLKRARHAVTENSRTIEAAEALKADDLIKLGKLMNASHISLRDDYEVTGRELDAIVSEAWKQDGVLGARMTGAGFGGCAIALVKEENVQDFIKAVSAGYKTATGIDAEFYAVEPGNGPGRIEGC